MDLHHENCPLTDALMNTVDALVVVADPAGRILQFNRACESITGYAADEMVGRPVDALVPADQRTGVADVIDDLASPGTSRYENDWLTKDGERRRIAWSNATMIDAAGDVAAIIGTGIDVTDQRLLESRLAQADRLDSVGRLAAGIAHDFNNGLTSLVLRIERLAARDLDPDSRVDVDAISSMIDKTQNLINELLSFSSPRRPAADQVAVHAEIERVVDALAGLLGPDIDVELELNATSAAAQIDPIGFEQALTNLVINACDAMPDGGRLTLRTADETIEPRTAPSIRIPSRLAPGPYVRVTVADTGTGIQPDDVARVFDPYFTTKPSGRGTGLGLATTYATITQQGGAISVDSEPGLGTEFEVWLPVGPGRTGENTSRASGLAESRRDGPHLALIVDDDAGVRHALAEEFARLGCRTITAATGAQALRHLDDPIDLLLTDLQLPDIGGREVADRFRGRAPDLAVVYATGGPTSQLDALADDAIVLRKPFTMAELIRTIEDHLGRSMHEHGAS